MDIKGIINAIIPVDREVDAVAQKDMKSQAAGDRDANGQMSREGGEDQRPLTDEELKKAIEKLKSFDGIQQSGLRVRLVQINERRFVLVEDATGKVVRRIPEHELRSLIKDPEQTSRGHLLNKVL